MPHVTRSYHDLPLLHGCVGWYRIKLEAVYAAPFQNGLASSPAQGMSRSYDEIVRLLALLGRSPEGVAYTGATAWMDGPERPVPSPATDDLIARALAARPDPLYMVAIAAPTNVASALLLAPEIAARIVVVWLGGNAGYWPTASEFNLDQDLHASRVLFDSGVPLVHVPCLPVADHLITTLPEIERFVKGRGPIGDYLHQVYAACEADHFGRSRVIWDLGPVAWLVNPAWADSALAHSPILTAGRTWSHDPHRHLMREVRSVQRDMVFGDLYRKLENAEGPVSMRT